MYFFCFLNLWVLQPKRIVMELKELSDASAVLPAVLGASRGCSHACFDSSDITHG